MNHNHSLEGSGVALENILMFSLLFGLGAYILAVFFTNRTYRKWPIYRTVFWTLGVGCIAIAVMGPIANSSTIDFTNHMLGHLLLGMLAPLLMVLAAPVTLILRTLSVEKARVLSRFLKSKIMSIFRNPIVTSVLNIGTLWILYITDLYAVMHQNIFIHVIVHVHVFLAGYLFTASLIYIDPIHYRYSYIFRTIVFMIALAGHGILSKYIYANPINGVPIEETRMGGRLMYYGGDLIDLCIIIILYYQWYKTTRPKEVEAIIK